MPIILNIETSTDICSVCIAKGETILSIQESPDAYSHAAAITLLIEACAKEAGIKLIELDAIAISAGPGSYTALRVGASVAKGICYALDKPMIAIDTLEALAHAASKEKEGMFYIPMIDARRMEVYTSVFDQELNNVAKTHNLILDETSFAEYFKRGQIVFCGNGAPKSKATFAEKNATYSIINCSSQYLVSRALSAFREENFQNIAYYSPVYYKAPNITVSKKIL